MYRNKDAGVVEKSVYIGYGFLFVCMLIVSLNLGGITGKIINRVYPEFTVSNEELSGSKVDLKDFELLEDGRIRSVSTDPWIYIDFELNKLHKPLNVNVQVDDASNENERVFLYYVGSYQYTNFVMSAGEHLTPLELLKKEDTGLRLDLTGNMDETVKIRQIVLNDNFYLTQSFVRRVWGCLLWIAIFGFVIFWRLKKRSISFRGTLTMTLYSISGMFFACQTFAGGLSTGNLLEIIVFIVLLFLLGTLCLYDQLDAIVFLWLYIFLHAYLQYKLNNDAWVYYLKKYLFTSTLVVNVLLVLLILLALQKLVGRHLGNFLYSSIYIIYAVACIIKMKYQNALIRKADLLLTNELVGIAGKYVDSRLVIISAVCVALICVLAFKYRKKIRHYLNPQFNILGIPATILAGILIFCIVSNGFKELGIDVSGYFLIDKEQINAMGLGVYSLLEFTGNQKTNEPEGYNASIIEEIAYYKNQHAEYETQPNVILILAESLFEVNDIPDIDFNVELMENLTPLKVTDIFSPSYGGRTASAELEALTGMSNVFIEGDNIVYASYLSQTGSLTGSLAREFREAGYRSYAIHANNADYYNRDVVYENMGFDNFISKEDFKLVTENYLSDGYVKDEVFVSKIIETLENEENPVFIFGASLEGHSPYLSKYDSLEIEASSTLYENSRLNELSAYGQTVYNFDKQMGRLVDYLDGYGQETLLYIFGDHLPPIGINEEDGYLNDIWHKYNTPLYAYSNYCDVCIEEDFISLNQIAPEILKKSGIEYRAYFDYIYQLRDTYPVLHKEVGINMEDEKLKTYNRIQWDLIFGERYLLK